MDIWKDIKKRDEFSQYFPDLPKNKAPAR